MWVWEAKRFLDVVPVHCVQPFKLAGQEATLERSRVDDLTNYARWTISPDSVPSEAISRLRMTTRPSFPG